MNTRNDLPLSARLAPVEDAVAAIARGEMVVVVDSPDREVEFWSAVVLDVAGVPAELAPAMFECSRTAGRSAHILEQKQLGKLVRPSAEYVGPPARALSSLGLVGAS